MSAYPPHKSSSVSISGNGNVGDTMNEDSLSNAGLSRRDVLLGGAIATVTAVEGGRG